MSEKDWLNSHRTSKEYSLLIKAFITRVDEADILSEIEWYKYKPVLMKLAKEAFNREWDEDYANQTAIHLRRMFKVIAINAMTSDLQEEVKRLHIKLKNTNGLPDYKAILFLDEKQMSEIETLFSQLGVNIDVMKRQMSRQFQL